MVPKRGRCCVPSGVAREAPCHQHACCLGPQRPAPLRPCLPQPALAGPPRRDQPPRGPATVQHVADEGKDVERAVPDFLSQARQRHPCPCGPRPLHIDGGGLRTCRVPDEVPFSCHQWL
eukprot:15438920-Alexandrium_andersonii.AAC.1